VRFDGAGKLLDHVIDLAARLIGEDDSAL
jgi:hypothetical protein